MEDPVASKSTNCSELMLNHCYNYNVVFGKKFWEHLIYLNGIVALLVLHINTGILWHL